jgi:hypothetical protein
MELEICGGKLLGMKLALILLFLSGLPAFAQKMHVKVIDHQVDGVPFTRFVPGIGLSNGSATAYGNAATASGSSVYLPAHTMSGSLAHIQMLLLLPDGRRVGVYCDDHFRGLAQSRIHTCKNPEVDEFDADFSGKNVKLTWGVGLDGKKKESETYVIGKVFAANELLRESPKPRPGYMPIPPKDPSKDPAFDRITPANSTSQEQPPPAAPVPSPVPPPKS